MVQKLQFPPKEIVIFCANLLLTSLCRCFQLGLTRPNQIKGEALEVPPKGRHAVAGAVVFSKDPPTRC